MTIALDAQGFRVPEGLAKSSGSRKLRPNP
jgi:hypothetical protein